MEILSPAHLGTTIMPQSQRSLFILILMVDVNVILISMILYTLFYAARRSDN